MDIETQVGKPYEIMGRRSIGLPSGARVAYPFYGQITPDERRYHTGTLKEQRDAIRADGLVEPDGSVAAEFVAIAGNHDEREFHEARDILNNGYFRVYEGHVYDGDSEKLFVVKPTLIEFDYEDRLLVPEVRELEKKIKDGDARIRVLPFNKLHLQVVGLSRPEEIALVRPYLELVYGDEGAEQLLDLASKTKRKEICTGFPKLPPHGLRRPVFTICSLDHSHGERLHVCGCDHRYVFLEDYGGRYVGAHAFGVFEKTGEATRAKKQE